MATNSGFEEVQWTFTIRTSCKYVLCRVDNSLFLLITLTLSKILSTLFVGIFIPHQPFFSKTVMRNERNSCFLNYAEYWNNLLKSFIQITYKKNIYVHILFVYKDYIVLVQHLFKYCSTALKLNFIKEHFYNWPCLMICLDK